MSQGGFLPFKRWYDLQSVGTKIDLKNTKDQSQVNKQSILHRHVEVSVAWDGHNRPEVFTTETSNHARQSGGVVVEIRGRKLMSFLKAAIQFDWHQ
jgi:hypothetical protein